MRALGVTRVAQLIFRATKVPLVCDDGTHPRHTFAPISARLLGNDTFDHDDYAIEGRSGDQFFYRVKGRLRPGGRATGYVIAFAEPYDPPSGSNLPECTTFGKARWKALRVR